MTHEITHKRSRKKKEWSVTPFLMSLLILVFVVNQFMIGQASAQMGIISIAKQYGFVFRVQEANAMVIIMPILDEGGGTTHLQEMPTITGGVEDPGSGDLVADGMAVMIGTGTTFYAPEGVSFDDAIGALDAWGVYDRSIELSPELDERYKYLISIFACNFCCGSPSSVAVVGRCGCAHAAAARGFFKYMLDNYGDTYSNDELVGEGYRWQAIWYPAGVVEDYLLYTGRGDAIGHKPHGGVGADGMHGMIS